MRWSRRTGIAYPLQGIVDRKSVLARPGKDIPATTHYTADPCATGGLHYLSKPDRTACFSGLERWAIEPRACWQIKKILDLCGVNTASMFSRCCWVSEIPRVALQVAAFEAAGVAALLPLYCTLSPSAGFLACSFSIAVMIRCQAALPSSPSAGSAASRPALLS
jgi:hypothetical protein